MKDRTHAPRATSHPTIDGAEAASRAGPTWPEVGFGVFASLVYFGVHFGLNTGEVPDALPVDGMATVTQAIVLLVGTAFVVRHHRSCTVALGDVWPFLALLALAATSSVWSQAPEASLRRSLTLATLITFTVYAHAVLGTLATCRLHVITAWIAALASFAVAAIVPASGFDVAGYANAVRGVFSQKNSLGNAMVVGMVALSGVVLRRRRILPRDIAFLGLAVGTSVLAQATTSILLCLLVALLTVAILLLIEASAVAVLGLLAALSAACLAAVSLASVNVFDLLGKDATLTGRVEIWAAVRQAIADGSVLGHGYSAFWLPETPAAQNVWAAIGWVTPSAHSGYLELQLELGLPGLVLMASLALLTLSAAARAWWRGHKATAGWTLIVLTITAITNYNESALPRPEIHLLQWILAYAACSASARLAAANASGALVPAREPRRPLPDPAAAGRGRLPPRQPVPSRDGPRGEGSS